MACPQEEEAEEETAVLHLFTWFSTHLQILPPPFPFNAIFLISLGLSEGTCTQAFPLCRES